MLEFSTLAKPGDKIPPWPMARDALAARHPEAPSCRKFYHAYAVGRPLAKLRRYHRLVRELRRDDHANCVHGHSKVRMIQIAFLFEFAPVTNQQGPRRNVRFNRHHGIACSADPGLSCLCGCESPQGRRSQEMGLATQRAIPALGGTPPLAWFFRSSPRLRTMPDSSTVSIPASSARCILSRWSSCRCARGGSRA
jgi:hypothetical protein